MSFSKDMIAKAPEVAAQLKLLSNPNRLLIVCRLLDGELSVGDIEEELEIRQPTLSRELGHLRAADIISPRRQSKVVFYSLTNTPMRRLIEAICAANSGKRHPNSSAAPSHAAPSHAATADNKAPAFNPRPKFTNARQPAAEDRGYSVFASTPKQGA